MRQRLRALASVTLVCGAAACGDPATPGGATAPREPGSTPPVAPTASTPSSEPVTLASLGLGAVTSRYTAELWVRGSTAYTTTWGIRGGARGDAVFLWDVAGDLPRLADSVIVADATTLGDVQVSDDGALLVVAIEPNPYGGIAIYALDPPRAPRLLARTTGGELRTGVHTAELARVNGVLYAFCAANPAPGVPGRLVILDLSVPSAPQVVWSEAMGNPILHDVHVRDGWMFTSEWNDGVGIWDIGARAGSPAAPRRTARVRTVGGKVHNAWRLHDAAGGGTPYLLVGEEGSGVIGSSSIGDLHVVDLGDGTAPKEVAAYTVPGAGAHNVSVDEQAGIAYVAFYNGGVRALDVRGALGSCAASQRRPDGRCDLTLAGRERGVFRPGTPAVFVWGVHAANGAVYASDMLNGLWKVSGVPR